MITSASNARVKELIELQKKPKERRVQDVFVAEGPKMFREVPPEQLVHTYVSEEYYQKNEMLLKGNREVTVLADRIFGSVSETRTPQGVLCIVRQSHYDLKDLTGESRRAPSFLVALENLQDPGNLGTIVRTAEAAGVTGILLDSACVDLYNPKTIRSTMGAVFRMPFFYTDNFERDLRALRKQGVRWAAAHLAGSTVYDEEDYSGSTGLLIGNESRGLTDRTAALADVRVRIPMSGRVESLNAAAAAAVLMYEVNRQRRRKQNVQEGA